MRKNCKKKKKIILFFVKIDETKKKSIKIKARLCANSLKSKEICKPL